MGVTPPRNAPQTGGDLPGPLPRLQFPPSAACPRFGTGLGPQSLPRCSPNPRRAGGGKEGVRNPPKTHRALPNPTETPWTPQRPPKTSRDSPNPSPKSIITPQKPPKIPQRPPQTPPRPPQTLQKPPKFLPHPQLTLCWSWGPPWVSPSGLKWPPQLFWGGGVGYGGMNLGVPTHSTPPQVPPHPSHLLQESERSPNSWMWSPWGPGGSPDTAPSTRQRPGESCRNRTSPRTPPGPPSAATAAPPGGAGGGTRQDPAPPKSPRQRNNLREPKISPQN